MKSCRIGTFSESVNVSLSSVPLSEAKPARPEAQSARPEAQPDRPRALPDRPDALPDSFEAQPASSECVQRMDRRRDGWMNRQMENLLLPSRRKKERKIDK